MNDSSIVMDTVLYQQQNEQQEQQIEEESNMIQYPTTTTRTIQNDLMEKGYCIFPAMLSSSDCHKGMLEQQNFIYETIISISSSKIATTTEEEEESCPIQQYQDGGAGWIGWDIRVQIADSIYEPFLYSNSNNQLVSSNEGFIYGTTYPQNSTTEPDKEHSQKVNNPPSNTALQKEYPEFILFDLTNNSKDNKENTTIATSTGSTRRNGNKKRTAKAAANKIIQTTEGQQPIADPSVSSISPQENNPNSNTCGNDGSTTCTKDVIRSVVSLGIDPVKINIEYGPDRNVDNDVNANTDNDNSHNEKPAINTSNHHPKITKETIILNQGDVLLWRQQDNTDQQQGSSTSSETRALVIQVHRCSIISFKDRMFTVALLPCCMRPVSEILSYNQRFRKEKIQAYKERRTAISYDPYETDAGTNNGSNIDQRHHPLYPRRQQRQYFRTGPPVLTIRQAQLAGLLPYDDECTTTNINNNMGNDIVSIVTEDNEHETITVFDNMEKPRWTMQRCIEQAIIQGVRFKEYIDTSADRITVCNQSIESPSPIITDRRYPFQNIDRDAYLEYIALASDRSSLSRAATSLSDGLAGQDKYLGGMAAGKYVYGVPGSATRVLRIDVETGRMDFIGPTYPGKFKWLRGLTVPPKYMEPSTSTNNNTTQHDEVDNVNWKYPQGCCFALPCNSPSILMIDPATNNVCTFGHDVIAPESSSSSITTASIKTNGWYYHGGNLSTINGWVYAIPANASRVLKFYPPTQECQLIGPVFTSSTTGTGGYQQRWFGGIVGSDSCIYGIPHNERGVLKIDPRTDEVTVLYLDDGSFLPAGQWKWHGGLRAGHKIYGFPNNADHVLVIDCEVGRVYTTGDTTILQAGHHRIPNDGRYKYLGGAVTMDGSFAYLFPCDAERVLRINCLTDELTLVGPRLLDGENKFQNGFCASDGCLYGIPQRAMGVLRIIPASVRQQLEQQLQSQSKKQEQNSSIEFAQITSCNYSKTTDVVDEDYVDIMVCEGLESVKDKFEGGVMGSDGCIYCIPLRSKVCVKIVPANVGKSVYQTSVEGE